MARDIFSQPWVFDATTQGEGGSLGTTWITHGTFTSATNDITTMAAHGFTTGNGPVRVANSGGSLPTGLAINTDYYVERLSATTFSFCTSIANAQAGTVIDITGAGSGTNTLSMQRIFPGRIYVRTIIFEAAGSGGTYEIHDAVGGRTLTGLLSIAANAHEQIVIDDWVKGVYLTTLSDGRALIYHGAP